MAQDRARKVTELAALASNSVANGDLFIIVDVSASETKKITANNMATYFVGLVNKGEKGEAGAAGSKGDTGSKGEVGDKGAAGAQGSAGSAGTKGQKGEVFSGIIYTDANNTLTFTSSDATSNAYVSGVKGAKGEIGTTGSTGAKGDKGSLGDTGAKGDTGSKGEQAVAALSLRDIITVNTTTYTANSTNDIIFCSPSAAGANITITLPSTAANGKSYTVKVIAPGGNQLIVGSSDATSRIEDVSTGSLVLEYSMSAAGAVRTWVCDGGYYRIIG
jgi:hypothetical protein